MSVAPLILVVEDSPSVRETMVRTLEISGFRVRAAGRAMDAVALAKKEPPDLILTDVQLPDLDGASAAAYLKDDPAFAGIPVLLVSVLSPEELEEKMAETGAVDAIQKPFSSGELVRRVKHWIAANAQGGEEG